MYGLEIIIPNLVGYKRFFYTDNPDDAFKKFINDGNTGLEKTLQQYNIPIPEVED